MFRCFRFGAVGMRRAIAPFGLIFSALLFSSLPAAALDTPTVTAKSCQSALDRVQTHRVEPGETLESVASAYRLRASTLSQFNPGISGALTAGSALKIPPFNGILVRASGGDTWQSVAERYESRADVLFEVNGCSAQLPSRIFIPRASPIVATASQPNTLQLPGYPLAQPADINVSYGWQPHSSRDELVFNSGLAFDIRQASDVRAVGEGTVAFAGYREGYGLLLVINHEQGVQTRYANLSDISVSVGQSVGTTTTVGRVGTQSPSFLYFEVRTNSASGWIAQDPGKYLPALELR